MRKLRGGEEERGGRGFDVEGNLEGMGTVREGEEFRFREK